MVKDLFGKKILFFDGAMGTMLQEAGLKTGEMPDNMNISHPETVIKIHEKYLAAGSDIITTNTFGCNTVKLKDAGYSKEAIVTKAVENAKMAARAYMTVKPRFVALDIGPTGKLLKPLGDLHFNEAISLFEETVSAGSKAGADLILIETMSDTHELKAAVLAAKENCDLPVIASVTLDERGRMLTGGSVDVVIALLEGLNVDVIGFNCGLGPQELTTHAAHALSLSSTPLLLMPNAGLPCQAADGSIYYNVTPDEFAENMKKNAKNGIWLLGGCCGTTPAHIEALVDKCAGINPAAVTKKIMTIISSGSKTVKFGSDFVINGERINPTGKPHFRRALKNGDYSILLQEGISQKENGAVVLDVNTGVPGIDEAAVLTSLVEQLQEIINTPLSIDTSDINAMAQAMRIYNGKPLVNSISGKKSVMDNVFPLIRKYGGVVIALTLDENGIPETVEGRIKVAEKIIAYAKNYGIDREAFLFDPLTMAVSAGQDARLTLECVRKLKKIGLKTTLGVSNVSFGLPKREILNSAFLYLALDAGLDAAILNPNVQEMHQAIKNFSDGKPFSGNAAIDALLGKDKNFFHYLEIYGKKQSEDISIQTKKDNVPLSEAILKGLKDEAKNSAQRSLELHSPLEVIEQELIPALNRTGQNFEQGTIYLPQLLMSADAAKNAFAVIRTAMGNGADSSAGTIVIATVEGDIHDIGKNIVRAMLENYRFNVIDLGKDVPAHTVVEAVQKHSAKLAGLSALMTSTVAGMEKTIQALRKAAPDCKIMCGGAVLTKEYAEHIGADFYGNDAMASVRYAQKVFNSGNIQTSKEFKAP